VRGNPPLQLITVVDLTGKKMKISHLIKTALRATRRYDVPADHAFAPAARKEQYEEGMRGLPEFEAKLDAVIEDAKSFVSARPTPSVK
jgi:hypothetical protein